MNDKLYEELKEYCSYDLKEIEKTIEYFKNRLNEDSNYDCKSNLDNAIIDEIDFVLGNNYDYEIELNNEEKLEIARDIISNEDSLFDNLNYIIMNRINTNLKKKLKYLQDKENCCELDKDELYLYDFLKEIL